MDSVCLDDVQYVHIIRKIKVSIFFKILAKRCEKLVKVHPQLTSEHTV